MKKIIYTFSILFCSFQSRSQWVNANAPTTIGVHGMAVADNKLFIGTDYGVYYTTDGSTWTLSSTGIPMTSGFTFTKTLRKQNGVMYAGNKGSVYQSVDGASWTEVTGVAPGFVDHATYYSDGTHLLCGWAGSGGMVYSNNGGATWANCSGLANNNIVRDAVKVGSDLFVQTLAGICKSSDNGATWTTLSGGLPTYSGASGSLNQNHGVLISSIYTVGIYVSSDNGNNWTLIDASHGMPSNAGVAIYTDTDTSYLGCAGGKVFASTNDGYDWTDITGTGLPSFHIVECFMMYKGELYAGTNYGLYRRSMAVGVNEAGEQPSISVYPNPVTNRLTINAGEFDGAYHLVVLDVTGKSVYEGEQNGLSASIELGSLVPGIYHLVLTGDNRRSSVTFVKQ